MELRNNIYMNYLSKFGISDEAAKERCIEIFNTMFYGPEGEKVFTLVGEDLGYIEDTGNHDVRTEGMSYGMMMCVQMDRQDEFDRLWKWSKTYMFMEEGFNAGYFAWSCRPYDGKKNSYGAAPDGEEFFVMALILAGNRWGNRDGIFDYHSEARALIHTMINKGYDGSQGRSMFDAETGYIKFVAEEDFSDPSYHLPHFYELYAQVAEEADAEFMRKAAAASREYWKKACHPETGLSAEYADYDGTPHHGDYEKYNGRHDWFYSDAYRTILNIAVDSVWSGVTDWAKEEAEKYIAFFERPENRDDWDHIFEVDGTKLSENALHPIAIIATNACTAVLVDNENTEKWVKRFLETPLRLGDRRYYDNCLYFFSYMLLSGNYKKY